MVFSPVTLTDDLHRSRLNTDATESAEGSPHGTQPPLTRVSILETHIFDCPWCGDHNRVVILTSYGTVSRCLRCRDETIQPAACTSHTLLRQMRGDFAEPRILPPIEQSARTQTMSKEVSDAQGERFSH